jgi:hypothetical protein
MDGELGDGDRGHGGQLGRVASAEQAWPDCYMKGRIPGCGQVNQPIPGPTGPPILRDP